jgi:ABC-type branched-subunit amino acid transport system substrate-binding protein
MAQSARLRLTISLSALLAAGLTACGSSGDSGASTTPPAGASSAAKPPSKAPIKVMMVAPIDVPPGAGLPFPELGTAARAAVKTINDAGGINEHPIDLTICDTHYNENDARACGRKAVRDGHVALVGGISLQTGHIQLAAKERMPVLGDYPAATIDFQLPTVFPLVSGAFNSYGCTAELIDAAKLKSIAVITIRDEANASLILQNRLKEMIARRGGNLVRFYQYDPGTPDMTPIVSAAITSDVEGVYISGGTADADKLTQTIRQLKPDVAIARTSVSASSIKTLGTAAEDVYVCDSYLPASSTSTPGVKEAVDAMKAQDSRVTLNTFAMNTWGAFMAFKQIAGKLATIDSKSLTEAIKSSSSVDTGIGPVVDFTQTVHKAELELPYVYNFTWSYNQVKDGVVENINDGKFVDPLAP